MTTMEEIFEAWAPSGARWSPWAKPVLFAHASAGHFSAPLANVVPSEPSAPPQDLIPISAADGSTALVLDVPGPHGVTFGLLLAERGYRPVPLYNSLPSSSESIRSAVDIAPILAALIDGAARLRQLRLPDAAAPAFLLDSRRRHGSGLLMPGDYDNRSVSLPTDFPSASVLLAAGITRVMQVREIGLDPEEDLAHTLLRWQQAGIQIQSLRLSDPEVPPTTITIRRPRLFRAFWQRLAATMGLMRSPLGGFGGILPITSAGG